MSCTSAPANPPSAGKPIPQGSLSLLRRFTVLFDAPRELWLLFAIKLVAVAAYGITNSTIKLWLSSDFGYSDQKALAIVAGWSLAMTAATVFVGSLADAVGLRRTFFIGIWFCIGARAVMAFTNLKAMALLGGLVPLAVARPSEPR